MDTISTPDAPEAVGAYSQGTVHGDMIHTSGQVAIDPDTGDWVTDDFEKEVRRILSNLLNVVEAGGGSRSTILKTTVYLTDLSLYSQLNDVYADWFKSDLPARSAVEVRNLPGEARLEIEATATIVVA